MTSYWSIWDPAASGAYLPRRDDILPTLALQAIYEYWVVDGNNATSASGVKMIEPTFMSTWNWDARPFPVFPLAAGVWGDAANWPYGQWLNGKGPFVAPPVPDTPPEPGDCAVFPTLATLGWSVHVAPGFATGVAPHVSGRESRRATMAAPAFWEIVLAFDVLRSDTTNLEVQAILAFYDACRGQNLAFLFAPPGLSPLVGQGFRDGRRRNDHVRARPLARRLLGTCRRRQCAERRLYRRDRPCT